MASDYYPHTTLSLLANLSNNEVPSLDKGKGEEGDEYILVVDHPETKEEIPLAKVSKNPASSGKHLYYDPIKREILVSGKISGDPSPTESSIKGTQNRQEPLLENELLTGDAELKRVEKEIIKYIKKYRRNSKIYKRLNLSINLITFILLGFVAMAYTNRIDGLIISIVALVALILKGIHVIFGLGKIGITYRNSTKTLKEYLMEINRAQRTFTENDEKENFALSMENRLLKMSTHLFKASYGPSDIEDPK